jgi:hypothetical protein
MSLGPNFAEQFRYAAGYVELEAFSLDQLVNTRVTISARCESLM